MDLAALIDVFSKAGPAGVLLFIVWAFYSEKLVSGSAHQRVIKERDAAMAELLTTLRVADRATRITERSVDIADARLNAEKRLRTREPRYEG